MQTAQLQGISDSVYLGMRKEPRLRVLLYDQTDTLSDIVLSKAKQAPLDITQWVVSCSISESEDSASTASMSIISKDLSPYHFVGRRIVRILWSDNRLAEFSIPEIVIFTGVTVGQPEFKRNRESGEAMLSVSCTDRSMFYNKRKLESPSYETGNDLGDVLADIATDTVYGMGMQQEECRFGLLRSTVQHTEISLFDVQFFEGFNLVGFIVDKKPAFDREGFLVMRDTSFTKPPVRKYDDETMFMEITWPQSNIDIYNRVRIVGLSASMEKILSPKQELAQVRGTAGFFQDRVETRVWFTEDHNGRAESVVISSYVINGQLSSILESEPYLKDVDEFSCVLVIPTPYQAWVFVVWFIVYIAFFIVGAIFAALSPYTSMAAAIWLCAGLMIMQQLGTFDVTISGTPYKMVYKELEGVAEWANLLYYEVRELTIENHLVYSQALADSIAKRELIRETAKQNVRQLTIPHDPFLEVHDIIEMPDGTLYYITSISKSFQRDQAHNMNLDAIVIRNGKEYSQTQGFSLY